ncbi:MAG: formimidoylglutamate deiminase [Phycisphaeraceae bacterium]|nr:formimidoylglutamate deiminase [Phycisphaeraceae bacterium]
MSDAGARGPEATGAAAMTLEADLTWFDGAMRPGVRVSVSADGTITGVATGGNAPVDRRLHRAALLPGFINAHSHAFQRALRGRGETAGQQGSFWAWRDAMYGLVETLDAATLERWTRSAFREMLASGITTVGEFHYLRHAGPDTDFSLDDGVLRAAAAEGIRIVLIAVCYMTGGIGAPLGGAQRRFRSESIAQFLDQQDRLAARLDPRTQHPAMAAHSIRAVGISDIVRLGQEATARRQPFHMHVEEQRQEIEASLAHYGRRPMQIIIEQMQGGKGMTAVHCTHTDAADLATFVQSGGIVCLCPLTEANLADGVADVPRMLEHAPAGAAGGGSIAIGTDSNARLSMLEEMRWLELAQRLRLERRAIVTDSSGRVGARLLRCATEGGAASLGLDAGAIRAGARADFAIIDLDHPMLEGSTALTLPDALVLGGGDGVVRETWVAGTPVWQRGPQITAGGR